RWGGGWGRGGGEGWGGGGGGQGQPRPQPKRDRRLGLSARDRKHARAHGLGDVGRGIGRQRDQKRDEFGQQPNPADEVEAAQLGPLEADRKSHDNERDERRPDEQRGAAPRTRALTARTN